MTNQFNLTYSCSTTGKLWKFRRDGHLRYEREDGEKFNLYQMGSRFDFVRQGRVKQIWVKNANGFKIRVRA